MPAERVERLSIVVPIGIIVATSSIIATLVSTQSGRLNDRMTQRQMIVWGMLLSALGVLLNTMMPGLWLLLIPAFIRGIAQGLMNPPLYTLLRSPKHSLDLTMYELQDPQVEQALIADAQRKVTVRVLLDKAFHGQAVNKPAFARLQSAGIAVQWASTNVTITHQKSFVIDGKKAVVMTGNFTAQF